MLYFTEHNIEAEWCIYILLLHDQCQAIIWMSPGMLLTGNEYTTILYK